jgi:hypothetical protein
MHQAEVPAIPISIFYSYAHEDTRHQQKIAKQLSVLKRQNHITAFSKRDILPGQEWKNEISQKLKTADIILLLVSADFIDSDYCYTEEMTLALQRHRAKEARVIPIILSPCEWKESPLGKLNPLPNQGTPVIYWKPQVKAYDDIAKGVRRVVDDVRRRKSRGRVTLHAEQAIEQTHFVKSLPKHPSVSPLKSILLDAGEDLGKVLPKVLNFIVNSFSLDEIGKRAKGPSLIFLTLCTILDIFVLPYLFYLWLKVAFLYPFIIFGLTFLIGITNKKGAIAYLTTFIFTLLWFILGLNHSFNYLNTSLLLFWIFIAVIFLFQAMLFRPHNSRRRPRRIF